MAKLAEMARLLDLGERRVMQLAKDGVIPRPTSKGDYDLNSCVIAYVRYLRAQAQGQGTSSLTDERARLAKEQADKLSIENKLLRGEAVDIEDAADVFGDAVEVLRNRLLGMGDRLSPHVVGVSDYREAKRLIDAYTEELLVELAETDLRRAIRVHSGDSGTDEAVETASAPEGERVGGQASQTLS